MLYRLFSPGTYRRDPQAETVKGADSMKGLNINCLVVLVPSLIAAVYGIAVILRRVKGLYFSMGVMAIVCQMIGQLAYCITAFTGHSQQLGFHVGTLGSVGSCLFFLTANIGPVDQLVDDKSRDLRKYRLLASTAPAAAIALFVFCALVMQRRNCYVGFITSLILTVAVVMPLYFSMKMAIIPDVKGGFIYCMRPYNYAVTALGLLNTLERGLRNLWMGETVLESVLMYVLYAAIGICTLVVTAFLTRGANQWKGI